MNDQIRKAIVTRSKHLLISFIPLCFTACNRPAEKEPPKQENYCLDEAFKKNLEFTTATKQQVSEGIHLTGTVEGNTDKQVVFKSLFNGIVSNVNFALGQTVSKGQILAEIKSPEYSALSTELNSLESQISVAETELSAVKAMYGDGLASQKEFNKAQSELNILKAQKAKVAQTQHLFGASATKDVFLIKAPASGVITQKAISAGMQISGEEAEPLFTVSNLDDVWVMANVYASIIRNITEGMEVEIRTVSYPDEVFRGRISMVPQVLDEASKVLKARIVIKNTGYKLKPGMLTDITALKTSKTEAISIRTGDLIFSDNEPYVVVYNNDCDLETRKIEVLAKNNDTLFIKSGLKENERVVSRNQLLIFNRLINR